MDIRLLLRNIGLTALLALGGHAARAQNTPDLSTTVPAGTASAITVPPAMTSTVKLNYSRTFLPWVPLTDAATLTTATAASVTGSITTFKDGSGSDMMSIRPNFANSKMLVQAEDTRSQQDGFSFLPYTVGAVTGFRSDPFTEQRNFYNGLYPGEAGISYGYTHNASSATKRSIIGYAAGKSQAGQGRGTEVTRLTNAASEVRIWNVDATGLPTSPGYYAAGQLFVEKTTVPNESLTGTPIPPTGFTYKDRDGNVVLQKTADSVNGSTPYYATTAYVYDDMGHLAYILSPKAMALIGTGTTVSTTILDNLCFRYTYDSEGRASATRKPGEGGLTFMVYDTKDRPVMRQSPLEKQMGKWEVTYYDRQGRVKATSLYTSNLTRDALQLAMDNGTMATTLPALASYIATDAGQDLYPPETGISGNEMMGYTWYDSYRLVDPGSTFWATYADSLQFSASELSTAPGAETPARSLRIHGMVTGTKVRILPSANAAPAKLGDWTTSVFFYDDKGRTIYTVSQDRYLSNAPVHLHYTGSQYDFKGRLLCTKHIFINNNSTDGTLKHIEWAKNDYDMVTGRPVTTWHKTDAGNWTQQASYTYDDLGRLKRKVMGDNGEVQDYSYNIRGQITGINALYAETGNKEGLNKTFGESLKYDYGFTEPRYDGKISGIVWRGSSAAPLILNMPAADIKHAYGYSYDLSGRLKNAEYRRLENPPNQSGIWTKTVADYTVSGLYYDKNGNILNMKQRGVQPVTGPVDMDVLSYTYMDGGTSNRLGYVNDAGVANYGAGDFQNTNTGTTDYDYDPDGNLKRDLNKGITAITYTHFDKPLLITFGDSKSIQYSYDAAGNKVQEIVKEPGKPDKRTDYLGNFIYTNDTAQHILTAEGRTVLTGTAPKEEYFVKDHLGNVRSVVDVYTYPTASYLATYEVASANLEGLVFENVSGIAEANPVSPGTWDLQSGRLNGTDPARRIGTSLLVKVMAGDKVSMNVNNFYQGYNPAADNPVPMATMLSGIVSTLVGGSGGFEGSEEGNTTLVSKLFTTANYQQLDNIVNSGSNPNRPKAYLNYVLFDEDMRIVGTMAGAFQANGNGSGNWTTIGTEEGDDLVMPANGYLAVYLSNKTASTCIPCADVYFDLLTVRFTRGNLLEETHYYPHGLPIYGLSGRTATGFQDNRRKYQSNEYIKDLGLNWMDFDARQYDPQIGRFLRVDPLADGGGQQVWSPYAAMGNAPESMVDPDGMQARAGGTLDLRTKNLIETVAAWDWRGGKWSPFVDGGAPEQMANGTYGVWSMGSSFTMKFQFEVEATRRMNDREEAMDNDATLLGQDEYGNNVYYYSNRGGFGYYNPNDDPNAGNGSTCPNCLDPKTVGQNINGLTYSGGNNAKSFNRQPNYSFFPIRFSDFPAIGHDRRYDRLKIEGLNGVLTDTRAIGADWKFIGENLTIALMPVDFRSRYESAGLALLMSWGAIPKTIAEVMKPQGLSNIYIWYKYSNYGVNNIPDIHKH